MRHESRKRESAQTLGSYWVALLTFSAMSWQLGLAQVSGKLLGPKSSPIANAEIRLPEKGVVAITDADGVYQFEEALSGSVSFTVVYFGMEVKKGTLEIPSNPFQYDFHLENDPRFVQGLVVRAFRTTNPSDEITAEQQLRNIPAPVTGELLRELPGIDGVRRGPVGIDPVIQGLRETEIGAYLDGTRLFPGGPARMDSALSHLDPSAIRKIQVVKGPYALTWGAGNLSAIRAETFDLSELTSSRPHGSVLSGYQSNRDAAQFSASTYGKKNRVSYWAHGVGRESSDYEDGAGSIVEGDFSSNEIRSKIGVDLSESSKLTLALGYQDQGDVDYPGRLLNADFFETTNVSLRWDWEQPNQTLHAIQALAYVNTVDHGMKNTGKPTAQPNPNRIPPFALDVSVDSEIQVSGARIRAILLPNQSWRFELGSDAYLNESKALRQIKRQDSGMVMFTDRMWPDAEIMDAGLFAHGSYSASSSLSLEGSLRVDWVRADAGEVSPFFQENASSELQQTEVNWNGSFAARKDLNPNWLVSLGIGSVARTADATERYSDRIPASKAQMSAEFMGNPELEPERSNQLNLWVQANYETFSFHFNGFARKIEDYITLEETGLARRLPLSPPTVNRYINGDARFWGFDASLTASLNESWRLMLSSDYTRGDDRTLDEPALGITPWKGLFRLRYQSPSTRYFLESVIHAFSKQDRVSTGRGELATPGYVTYDLLAHLKLGKMWAFRFGGMNLSDKFYRNHLNAKNPFTGVPVAEPGRILYGDIHMTW